MNRLTKKTIHHVSHADAQDAAALVAKLTTKLEAIEAKMNAEINRVKSKYEDDITVLTEGLEEPKEMLEIYAKAEAKNWSKKSLDLLHCTIGFRTNPPKVVKQKGFTWEAILALVSKSKALAPHYVRTKTELDKEAILATCDSKLLTALKDEAHLSITQDESFFVVPRKEEIEALA